MWIAQVIKPMENQVRQRADIARKSMDDEAYAGQPFNSPSEDAEFQRDRARIIHSSSFRRLQSKTQVLSLGESDFYRTRLTHSLEVAQIGSSICEHLKTQYPDRPDYLRLIPPFSLIEAICLAHDLGHPPFGHGGEIALNAMMKDAGGFEGNGQTLRIATHLGEYSPHHGLDLTRRTLLGLLKYPALHQDVAHYPRARSTASTNKDDAKPPKCIHDEEHAILQWILLPFDKKDRALFKKIQPQRGKHSKTLYKSFDTSIMELADDIAYGVHDLEDAVALNLVNLQQWNKDVVAPIQSIMEAHTGETHPDLKALLVFCTDKLFTDSEKDRKHAISKLVGYFVRHITIEETGAFSAATLRLNTVMDTVAKDSLQVLKKFVLDYVILRPQVRAIEFKGQQIICKLFDVLHENPQRLLPAATFAQYREAGNSLRVICDYIASMTDNQAIRTYNRIFTPNIGSFLDQ